MSEIENQAAVIDQLMATVDQLKQRLEDADDTLRTLSSWLGQGGCYGSDVLDYKDMESRIREGVDLMLRVEEVRRTRLSFEVLAFAKLMQKKLDKNAHKGGWKNNALPDLMARLEEESYELAWAIEGCNYSDVIAYEAADVANFAMMIADKCGAFKPGFEQEAKESHKQLWDLARKLNEPWDDEPSVLCGSDRPENKGKQP